MLGRWSVGGAERRGWRYAARSRIRGSVNGESGGLPLPATPNTTTLMFFVLDAAAII